MGAARFVEALKAEKTVALKRIDDEREKAGL